MDPRPPQPSLRHPFAAVQIYYVNSPGNPLQKRPAAIRIDAPLLEQLTYLCRQTARRTPKRSHYCFPSQAWLGERVGRTRETVNRHIRRLVELGLIEKTQRRKKDGHWRSCLYRVTRWVLQCIRHPDPARFSPAPPCDAKRTHSGTLLRVAAASPQSTTPTPSWAAAWAVRMAALTTS